MSVGSVPSAVVALLMAGTLSLTACSGSSGLANESFNPSIDAGSASPTASTPSPGATLPAEPAAGDATDVPTRTTLAGPATTVLAGTKLSLKASVRAERGITLPAGSVSFVEGSTVLATVLLVGGRSSSSAVLTTSLPAGTHVVVARYGGDKQNALSASAPFTVTAVRSVATVTIVVKPKANHGGRFRLAIDVRGVKPGPAGAGDVSIYVDGRRSLARLDAQGHTFLDVSLTVGRYHAVVVAYGGSALLTAGRATTSVLG
jgi:hypothetical protein